MPIWRGFVALGFFALAACDTKAPSEAHGALNDALAALAAGDRARFKAKVVAAQRTGALGFTDSTGFPSNMIARNATLDDLLALPFFSRVKGGKTDPDFDNAVTDDSARLSAVLEYGNRTIGARHWVMVKRDGAWLIDMKATVDLWQAANGGDAFTALRRTN